MTPASQSPPATFCRIVQDRGGVTWYYAGLSTWVRERRRAKLYRTWRYAERLARQHADGTARPYVEAV